MFCRLLLLASLAFQSPVSGERPRTVASPSTIMIKAPAGTVIWVDRLRYGKVTESGTLPIKNLSQGQHFLRARLSGKQEATQTFTNSTSGPREVTVKLSLPAGKAE